MWAKIDNKSERLQVPRGWVIRYHESEGGHWGGESVGYGSVSIHTSLVFIEDKDHTWVL